MQTLGQGVTKIVELDFQEPAGRGGRVTLHSGSSRSENRCPLWALQKHSPLRNSEALSRPQFRATTRLASPGYGIGRPILLVVADRHARAEQMAVTVDIVDAADWRPVLDLLQAGQREGGDFA